MLRLSMNCGTGGTGFTRREWLQVGGAGMLGMSLPNLLRAEATQTAVEGAMGTARSLIVLWLAGGPSQPDMWDMKLDAPAEVRGEFKPIATTVPGIQMCEHLPRTAKQAHHCTIIRSAHHKVGHAHCAAAYY